jgi:prepilin-type N-terminal cleavage/methylation domain-containing protein
MNKTGFTLIEVMIAAAISVVVLLGLLGAYIGCFNLNESAKNLTIAINGAQQKMEEIRNHCFDHFDTVVSDYSPAGLVGNTFTISPGIWLAPANQSAVVYILNPQTGVILNTGPAANPGLDLYEVRTVVCWRQRGARTIGEDNGRGGGIAFNGICDGAEDANGNNILDSPAQITTLITER